MKYERFNNTPLTENEYFGTDGLKYCKNCHTAREKIVGNVIFPTQCYCVAERENRKILAQQQIDRNSKIAELRKNCFNTQELQPLRAIRFNADDGKTASLLTYFINYCKKIDDYTPNGLGLILYGVQGSGKTWYAAAIANELINRFIRVKFITLMEVARMGRDIKYGESDYQDLLKNSVYIIDDIGTERDTPTAYESIYRFINDCYVAKKVIIGTTNLTLKQMKEYASDSANIIYARIYDRLLERCLPICFTAQMKRRETIREQNWEMMKTQLKGE